MDKVKELGQVMTPENIINHMIDDILKLNDIVEEHPNANVYDVEYKPKEKIEEKTTIDPFTGW